MLSTHAKTLINDWRTLQQIILEIYYAPNRPPEDSTTLTVLTDPLIENIWHGPFHSWLKQVLTAYSKLAQLRLFSTIEQDETFKTKINNLSASLRKEIVQFGNAELEKIQKNLDNLVLQQFHELDSHYHTWCATLQAALNAEKIPLTESEEKELSTLENTTLISKRYDDLQLAAPTEVAESLTFHDYLKLKVYLAMHNSLSRRHQPHQPKDIEAHLKHLKKAFHAVQQADLHFLKASQHAIDGILKPIINLNKKLVAQLQAKN